MERDDESLLIAWREGDRASGEELFARYFDRLYAFFSAKADAAEVADLVQKVFVGCVEGAGRFRGESTVRAYFYGVARNVLYRHYRTRRRAPEVDFGVSSLFDLAPSPSSIVHRAARERRLAEALERLPLELQLLIELRFDEGLSGPELADALGLKEGTVRSRLRRALGLLREALAEAPPAELERWDRLAE
ncbi:MAG: sigma-70 family RNA polymerase sigma factor [Myxococcota bacterium]|nr:sigma-70 family RNA polymerase sigma factor [Myxococcota bacterium]